ncbi:hypothetical protein MNV49_001263 [Pseudohyphozyma bogoriensis]|nr:hypothetical protein MNV49_001263 [Pseudohyphozyma bogoriensis]
MSLLRPFTACDLFSVNPINLDVWTETYSPAYYMTYLSNWVMGKTEGRGQEWHVDLFVRESNDLAIGLYESLGYMIFRRVVGYYSGATPRDPDEDGFDMRKPLKRDKNQVSIRLPNGATDGREVRVGPEDTYFH